jgi:hypothetical protein
MLTKKRGPRTANQKFDTKAIVQVRKSNKKDITNTNLDSGVMRKALLQSVLPVRGIKLECLPVRTHGLEAGVVHEGHGEGLTAASIKRHQRDEYKQRTVYSEPQRLTSLCLGP